ncbi:N-alpha-acetyltransferase 35 NatC auxiliary subunit [Lachnellula suecica]|uniref:N-alpha-acetyltransferase 35 NatC auxiliary subunit n=1 Tax=Lachnellula suecica TaxID=602035 RepID=A0A8T9BU36_9HELO|nr:N-alpha-acetyltransferase 35 NatC auxiliary subunit [Lachnellula suecica]
MHSNGITGITSTYDICAEIEDLDFDDGQINATSAAFAAYNGEPPPAPKLKSAGVVSMDITEHFLNAAIQLDMGQLVKDPYFTLFESVGALEIMDPKMDSGYLEPGETMEDDYDYSQPLLPEEIIGIIDQLLCHEMAWHMGHPLAQTIFTSLYIDRILDPCPTSLEQTCFDRSESCSDEPLTHQILRAYCLGLVKTCGYVNQRVKAEHYYEVLLYISFVHKEEDFVTHTFNRNLLENIDHDSIVEFIERTAERLLASNTIPHEVKDALEFRLGFRASFLETVDAASSRTSPDEIKSLWTDLLTLVPNLKQSIKLGKPVPASFSVKLQRKLASTVPPRPIVQVSQEDAFSHLERLCLDGSVAVEVLKYHNSHSLMTFVSLFQARKPQPSVYIRTLLQHYIFGDMIMLGKMSIRQVLDDDLSSTVLPANQLLNRANDEIEFPNDPRFKMAENMELFRSRAANSYLDILRTICQNRCRIRRTLCHTISDWDILQLDAEELDIRIREFTKETPARDEEVSDDPIFTFALSSWAYFYKLRQMEWIVQMGFELEIYQPDELATMYFYLQYLAKTRARHLERIRGFNSRGLEASRRLPVAERAAKASEFTNALSFVNLSTMEAAATYGFADSLSCLFTVLNRLSLIKTPSRPYSNDHMRYELRFKPFLLIGLPELVPFDELTRLVTQPSESSLDLLKYAAEAAMAAKRGFEVLSKLSAKDAFCQGSHESWVNNVKDCLKACIFTGITIAAVRKAVEVMEKTGSKEAGIKVEFPEAGKGYHDWWIVPKVTPFS